MFILATNMTTRWALSQSSYASAASSPLSFISGFRSELSQSGQRRPLSTALGIHGSIATPLIRSD
jgi:hypothetical protein